MLSTHDVLFEAKAFENVAQSVEVVNSGTTALFYEWAAADNSSEVIKSNRPEDVDTVEADAQRFFCHDNKGMLLPGQSKSMVFGFVSTTPGAYSQAWNIKTTPSAVVCDLTGAPVPCAV